MTTLPHPTVRTRDQLPLLRAGRGDVVAVLLGDLGTFALKATVSWPGKLYVVHDWPPQDYFEVWQALASLKKPCSPLRMTSQEAARCWVNESVDWLYIDGPAEGSLDLWLPKMLPSGIVSGSKLDAGVAELAGRVQVYVTEDASWFCVKGK
jgi:hypothetical protein